MWQNRTEIDGFLKKNVENLRTRSVFKGVYGFKYIFVRGNNAFQLMVSNCGAGEDS